MASVQEAVEGYCKAMMAMDIGTLMGSMTPEALGKAMALQGQGPQPGGGLQSYEIAEQGQEGDEFIYHLTLVGSDQSAKVMTRWKEIDGAWKVADLGMLEA
ncbi:MAG: hypothetical protein WEE64_14100 [Dehalococcoidia bacterium]